jgi:hypothetical protein
MILVKRLGDWPVISVKAKGVTMALGSGGGNASGALAEVVNAVAAPADAEGVWRVLVGFWAPK